MSLLLEDLAEETTTSNERVAERLDEEVRELSEQQSQIAPEQLIEQVIVSARQATYQAVARAQQAEGFWRLSLTALRQMSDAESAERLLRALVRLFESGEKLLRSPRALWETAKQLGMEPNLADELDQAERRFREMATEARSALEHRLRGWQPADPERLARGLQMAREGKTVTAEEARARFRTAKQQQG